MSNFSNLDFNKRTIKRDSMIISLLSKVKRNDTLLEFLIESSHMGIALINQEGQYIKVNMSFAESIDYSVEELEQMTLSDLSCPLFSAVNDYHYNQMADRKKDSYHIVKLYYNKQGKALNFRVSIFSLHSENNDSVEFLCFYQKSQPFYKKYFSMFHPVLQRLVTEDPSSAIFISGEKGQILYGNRSAANLLGYSEKEITDQKLEAILEAEQSDKLLSEVETLPPGRFFDCELTLYRCNGSFIHFPSYIFIDNTNLFKTDQRLILIICLNIPVKLSLQKQNRGSQENTEVLLELEKIRSTLQSLSGNEKKDEHFKPQIKLSDYGLTVREKDVLSLLLEKKSTKNIASQLHLAEISIRKHLTCLYRKFGVSGRQDLLLLLYNNCIE